MRAHRVFVVMALAASLGGPSLFLSGCSKGPAGAARSTPAFDRRWSMLEQQGTAAFTVEDDGGSALMGNVLGAQAGVLGMTPALQQSFKNGSRSPLPDQPDRDLVQRLMRQYLPGVRACYLRISHDGDGRSGKAIVSFQIAGTGHVQALNVDAPAFEGTALPSCITGQVGRWLFPPSRRGLDAMSYPFVFVGT